jgi:hypothetical protein
MGYDLLGLSAPYKNMEHSKYAELKTMVAVAKAAGLPISLNRKEIKADLIKNSHCEPLTDIEFEGGELRFFERFRNRSLRIHVTRAMAGKNAWSADGDVQDARWRNGAWSFRVNSNCDRNDEFFVELQGTDPSLSLYRSKFYDSWPSMNQLCELRDALVQDGKNLVLFLDYLRSIGKGASIARDGYIPVGPLSISYIGGERDEFVREPSDPVEIAKARTIVRGFSPSPPALSTPAPIMPLIDIELNLV